MRVLFFGRRWRAISPPPSQRQAASLIRSACAPGGEAARHLPARGEGDTVYRDARQYLVDGDVKRFYDSAQWQQLRREVLELDHQECQRCKAMGRHRRADRVHHVHAAKARPDLALSIWYEGEGGERLRNLVSLCFDCHEREHPNRFGEKKEPLTKEWWG